MLSSVASRRLDILATARAAGGSFLRFDPARLRFSLGTSLGDVRIPVQVAPDAGAIVRAAAAELAMLLAAHHRRLVPADDLDRLLLADGYASLPTPAASLGPSSGGPDLRAAAQLGAAAHPALTGGVLCAWMGRGGRGRSLTALFIEVLQRAFVEQAASREREETPLIALLALTAELAAADERVRAALPGPPIDRYLRAAALAGLWISVRTALVRAWRAEGRSADDALLARLEAVVSPGFLLGFRGGAIGGATLYGCELVAPPSEEVVAWLAQGRDPEAALGDLAQALAGDEEASRRAEAAVAVARLRDLLYSGVASAEAAGRGARLAELRDLYAAPGALAGACADDRARAELAGRLEDLARVGGAPGKEFENAAVALRSWRRGEPAACVGLTRAAARAAYAHAAGAYACDAALERLLEPARRMVVQRTGAEAEGGAAAEWEEGRLYRMTARAGPILNAAANRQLGHLFVDVKDFTRRTALLGHAAMAEFLRTEFYGPILTAAKSFFSGMPHLADRGGIAVNNLLGDAISFSGDIEALVALAAEIRRCLAAYQLRLTREFSTEAVANQLTALAARHAGELARAERALAEARAAGAPLGRLEQLEEHRARVARERERALARASGEGIEAGVFLSYGPAPVTVLIDDDVFGRNRVAIAEKINESARGTARAASARSRADAALAAARAATGLPALQHAWSVFVDRPLSISVPPELERAAVAASCAGDHVGALRFLAAPVREAVEQAARLPRDEQGDIYNSGAALSEEALTHFLDAVKETRQLRRVELTPGQIPEELQARWFYGESQLELVVAFHLDGRPAELFRRAGVAAFRGLGAVPVWELASDAGGSGELLRRFAARWLGGR